VEERLNGRISVGEVIEAVSEAQRLYVLDELDAALHILHSVLSRLESIVDLNRGSECDEFMNLSVWVAYVGGEILSDRGILSEAELQFERAIALARRYKTRDHADDSGGFVNQLIAAGQGLANAQGWSDRPNDAIRTLKSLVLNVREAHGLRTTEGLEGVIADINWWGEELGYHDLANRLLQEQKVTRSVTNSTVTKKFWIEPLPKLGSAYEEFEIQFSERVNALQEDEVTNVQVELDRLNGILKVVSEWLTLVPKSAKVRRFELEMLLRKSCVEAQLLNDVKLYESWTIIEQKYLELVIDTPDCGALPRNMASRLCTLSAIVISRRVPDKERSLIFYQFAIDREFDAFRMMESRKMASAMTQADALVWIRLTNLMSHTYRNFGDRGHASRRSAVRLTKIRNSFLRSLLRRDPRNDEGLRLLSEYGPDSSRASLRALLFHSKWRWRIEAID
jgi:hypothetical protein